MALISELNHATRIVDSRAPWVELHRITPSIAESILFSRNTRNRDLREWYAKALSVPISRGEYFITSQAIGFDRDGTLIDGQHRLRACVYAMKDIVSLVAFGLDPKAFEYIDTGMKRNASDLLGLNRRVSDVLKFCTTITHRQMCDAGEMRQVASSGLPQMVEALMSWCGGAAKFYASAPMRLAACIAIMRGGNAEYVYDQYRALVTQDFDAMSSISKCLTRQVNSGKARAMDHGPTLARGLIVFDIRNANLTKLYADGDENSQWARDIVRKTIMPKIAAVSSNRSEGRNDGDMD